MSGTYTEAKDTFKTIDVNGNEVELPWQSVEKLAYEWEREDDKCSLLTVLNAYCENNGLDASKISDATLAAMLSDYKERHDNDVIGRDWQTGELYADSVLLDFEDKVRAECETRIEKSHKPVTRDRD